MTTQAALQPATALQAHEQSPGRSHVNHPRAQTSPGVWMREYGQPITELDTTGGPDLRTLTFSRWKEHGACASVEPKLWFSEGRTTRTREALALCQDCPVRRLCLAFALVFREEFGVWGGLAVTDRRPLEARLVHGAPLGNVLAAALEPNTNTVRGAA